MSLHLVIIFVVNDFSVAPSQMAGISVRVRDVGGNVIRTYTGPPPFDRVEVPSFGFAVDTLLDGWSYVVDMYTVVKEAYLQHGSDRQGFVKFLQQRGGGGFGSKWHLDPWEWYLWGQDC